MRTQSKISGFMISYFHNKASTNDKTFLVNVSHYVRLCTCITLNLSNIQSKYINLVKLRVCFVWFPVKILSSLNKTLKHDLICEHFCLNKTDFHQQR